MCPPAGVIERWELIQAQSMSDKHRHKHNVQQWQQLISDLQTVRAWLGQTEAELGQLRGLELSTDIHTIQQRIKRLKVCQARTQVQHSHSVTQCSVLKDSGQTMELPVRLAAR